MGSCLQDPRTPVCLQVSTEPEEVCGEHSMELGGTDWEMLRKGEFHGVVRWFPLVAPGQIGAGSLVPTQSLDDTNGGPLCRP